MLISDSKGMKDAATQRILMYLKLLNESDKIKEDIIKKTLKNGDEAGDNEVDDGSKVETDKWYYQFVIASKVAYNSFTSSCFESIDFCKLLSFSELV